MTVREMETTSGRGDAGLGYGEAPWMNMSIAGSCVAVQLVVEKRALVGPAALRL